MHQSGHGPRAPPKCQRLRHPGLGAGRTLDSDTHHPPSGQGQVGARAPESCGLRGRRVRDCGLGQPWAPPLPPLSKWPPPRCSSWGLSTSLATGQRSERCVLSRSSSSPGLGPQQTPPEAPGETVTLKNCLGRRWGPKPRAKKQTVVLGGMMLHSPARQLGLLRGFSIPEPAWGMPRGGPQGEQSVHAAQHGQNPPH